MRALLLAAGRGTRLRPLTDSIPKCLVPIEGKPLIDYWIELLVPNGVDPLLVNTHWLSEQMVDHLRRSPFARHVTAVHEEELLGTGGTLLRNRAFFGGGPAMVVHADNLSCFDVQSFIDAYEHRSPRVEITMMTFSTTMPESCGIVELDDSGLVRRFHEKVPNAPGNLANAAVYIVSPNVIDFLACLGKDVIDFSTEVVPAFIGRINTFHNGVYHRDIGTPESLSAARAEFASVRRPPSAVGRPALEG